MVYDLEVTDAKGRALAIHGVKTVRHDATLDLWPDTTTLATEVRHDHRLIAAGTLRISVPGLLRQLASFRATASTPTEQAEALGRFGTFFLGHLWEVYRRRAAAPIPLPRAGCARRRPGDRQMDRAGPPARGLAAGVRAGPAGGGDPGHGRQRGKLP